MCLLTLKQVCELYVAQGTSYSFRGQEECSEAQLTLCLLDSDQPDREEHKEH